MNTAGVRLLEGLNDFSPSWREEYRTLAEAAYAAGVADLLSAWVATQEGARHAAQFEGTPDHGGIAKREQEAYRRPASLPFGYDTLGWLGDDSE